MPTIVSTGQITIVDQNDAKPITAFIAASGPLQQIFTKDESIVSYLPNWASTALVLTPKIYAGSTTEVLAAQLSNRKWSTDLSTSLGSAATYSIGTNLADGSAPVTYYFEADYLDPGTGMSTHIIAQITVSQVKTGTNAVFIQIRGQNVIETATGQTKNKVTLSADLIRAAGIDNTSVTYRWYQSPHNAVDQIDGNLASVGTKYGFLDTAATNASVAGAIGSVKTTAGGTTTAISTANIPDGGWVDLKSLVIDESAVSDIGVFRVEAKDFDGTVYQTYFTVYDISDPYDLKIVSPAGDKLQNGVGSMSMYPIMYNGDARVANLTGWTFDWQLFDRDGKRCAFVDTTRTAVAGGRNITGSTTGASAAFTFDGAAIALAAGDIIKVVKSTGLASFFEVAASGGNVATIRAASVNTWLAFTTPASTSDYASGKLYVCKTTGTLGQANIVTTSGSTVETAPQITVSGDEIDVKGTISCIASRP